MTLTDEKLEAAAKALWNSKPHTMLKHSGHPIDWESQPQIIKKDLYKLVRIVHRALTLTHEHEPPDDSDS